MSQGGFLGAGARRVFGSRCVLTAMGAASVVWLTLPASAFAVPDGSSFSCRASAARVALTGLPVLEPFVANSPYSPCSTDSTNVITPTTIGPLNVNVINVNTEQVPTTLGSASLVDGDHATASSTVSNPTLTLGSLTIHADVLDASVGYTCHHGVPVASNSGDVVNLVVNGQAITIPQGINQSISLGPLGTLTLNEVDTTATGIIRRAVDLTTPLGAVVIGEAEAAITANPCQPQPTPGTGSGSGTGPTSGTGAGTTSRTGLPGTAKLVAEPPAVANEIASGACVRGSFIGRVVGQRIARVVFSLDGRRIATVGRPPFQTRVGGTGRHRITAFVTFVAASHTKPRTLGLGFTGCAPVAAAFTG